MKRNQALMVCGGAVLAVAFVVVVFGAVAEKAPVEAPKAATAQETIMSPPTAAAVMVPLNATLFRVNRLAGGYRTAAFGESYVSPTGPTSRGTTHIHLVLGTPAPLDQSIGMVPSGSVLDANGTTFRRQDGLAAFTGNFAIKGPGPTGATLFTGTMDLLDAVGSHQMPFGSEAPNMALHQEGWLHGEGAGPLSGCRLDAAVVARGPLVPTASTPQTFQAPRVVGVLVKPL